MTALQFRTTLTRLGISQVQAAHILGVTPRTARRWALGEVAVPTPAGKLLRLMRQGHVTERQVRAA